jgi:hypothetical protein
LLFGLKPWDPVTLVGAAPLLALVTVVASVVPSLRAGNVNPIDSLRAEQAAAIVRNKTERRPYSLA